MTYSEILASLLKSFESMKEQYNIAIASRDDAEALESDLMHALELTDCGYHEKARIARRLSETLRNRREAKDTIEQLEPIVRWLSTAPGFISGLQRVLGDMRAVESKHKNRYYTPKSNGGVT